MWYYIIFYNPILYYIRLPGYIALLYFLYTIVYHMMSYHLLRFTKGKQKAAAAAHRAAGTGAK